MKNLKYLIMIACLFLLTSCSCFGCFDEFFGCSNGYNNNNNHNEKTYDSSNVINNLTLTVDKNKFLVNEDMTLSVIIDNGIWFNTGSKTEKSNLRIFYYVNDSTGSNRLLGNSNLDETFKIHCSSMETIEIYCILAHRDYQSSKTETEFLKSNVIQVKITGNEISTAQELQNIQKKGNYILMNDIDLSGFDFKIIDEFNGSLDGQGYSIKNLTLNVKQNYVGLFGKCNGKVKNIKLENVDITIPEGAKEFKYVGGITGYSSGGYFEDITVSGNITAYKTSYVGGIAGYVYKPENHTLTNLKNEANITGSSYAGGIFGSYIAETGSGYSYTGYNAELDQIENEGTVIGTGDYVGGLFGNMNGDSSKITMENCKNIGSINGNLYVGGIAGKGFANCYNVSNKSDITGVAYVGCLFGRLNGSIEKCYNDGSTLEATGYDSVNTKNAYVGGFVGYGMYLGVKNCVNKVDINYTSDGSYVGGIAGYVYKPENHTLTNLKNEANITGASYVGGIFGSYIAETGSGYSYTGYNIEITNFSNEGNIIGTGDYVGGFFGKMSLRILTVKDSSNTATISGNKYVGGIVGYLSCSSSSEAHNLVSLGEVIGNEKYGSYFGEGTLVFKE